MRTMSDADITTGPRRRFAKLAEAIGLSYITRRHSRSFVSVAAALGVRLQEIFPRDDGWIVDVQGPVLTVRSARGGSSTGMPGMSLLPRGSADARLKRTFEAEAEALSNWVAVAHRNKAPGASFDPHVRVTSETVHVWWGGPTERDASVKLRPIPRAELGL
jgi:hypothetical protein